MNVRVGREQRVLRDALEYRAISRTETRQRVAKEIRLPVPGGTDAVDEHHPAHRGLVAFDG